MKYFMFSNGSYSDYCVGGLYVGDDSVPDDAWQIHCDAWTVEFVGKMRESQLQFLRDTGHPGADYFANDLNCAFAYGNDWWKGAAYRKWRDDYSKKTDVFISKWKLVQVEYQECHDCD